MQTSQTSLLIFVFLFFSSFLFCQNYSTCENALEICSKSSLQFEFKKAPEIKVQTPGFDCLVDSNAITWLTWEIAAPGYLTFTISPEDFINDVDFAVFKISDGNCKNPELVRCMQSGQNLGWPESGIPCLGPTGLTTAERSETWEDIGCKYEDNNFLAALPCKKGERYALAIQNYDDATGGFIIDFCGSAKLPCDTIVCEELTKKKQTLPKKQLVLFPSAVSGEKLPLFFQNIKPQPARVIVRDDAGKIVTDEEIQLEKEKAEYAVHLKNIAAGKYSVEVKLKKHTVSGTLTIDE